MRHPRRRRSVSDGLEVIVLEDVGEHHFDFVGYEEAAGATTLMSAGRPHIVKGTKQEEKGVLTKHVSHD